MKPKLTDELLQEAFKSADWEKAEREDGNTGTAFRDRAARAADTAPVRQSRPCPEPEWLWEAARGNLAPRQMRKIADHVATCPTCAFDFNAARKAAGELGEFVPPRSGWAWIVEDLRRAAAKLWRVIRPLTQTLSLVRDWLRDPWLPKNSTLSAAFGILTVLLIGLYVGPRFQSSGIHPTTSDHQESLVHLTRIRSPSGVTATTVHVPEHKTMSRDSFILEWEAIPGARYGLDLMTPALEVVATFDELVIHRVRIPTSDLENVSDGGEILWRVRAYLKSGEQIESKIQSVHLGPAQP